MTKREGKRTGRGRAAALIGAALLLAAGGCGARTTLPDVRGFPANVPGGLEVAAGEQFIFSGYTDNSRIKTPRFYVLGNPGDAGGSVDFISGSYVAPSVLAGTNARDTIVIVSTETAAQVNADIQSRMAQQGISEREARNAVLNALSQFDKYPIELRVVRRVIPDPDRVNVTLRTTQLLRVRVLGERDEDAQVRWIILNPLQGPGGQLRHQAGWTREGAALTGPVVYGNAVEYVAPEVDSNDPNRRTETLLLESVNDPTRTARVEIRIVTGSGNFLIR